MKTAAARRSPTTLFLWGGVAFAALLLAPDSARPQSGSSSPSFRMSDPAIDSSGSPVDASDPTRDSATMLLFAWTDIREVRPPNAHAFAILNDTDQPLKQDILSAFQQYDVKPLLWSQRAQYVEELVA